MRWFANLRTMMKLITGFGIVTIILAIVGTSGLSQMADIKRKVHDMNSQSVEAISSLHEVNLDLNRFERRVASALASTDNEALGKLRAHGDELQVVFSSKIGKVEKLVKSAAMKDGMGGLRTTFTECLAALATLQETATEADASLFDQAAKDFDHYADELDEQFEQLARMAASEAQSTMLSAERAYGESQTSMLILIGTAILLSVTIGVGIGRMVSRPLVKAAVVLKGMANGDFTGKLDIDTTDEIGDMAGALNKAVDDVSAALRDVRLSAFAVSGASNELSSASQDISNGAQEQASSIESSATSLERLTHTIRENANRAQQASLAALTSRDVAEKGGEAAQDAVSAMSDINKASNRISEIVSAIDEIAFQTNLLALNAAVEAARAGEQGRGFAVVAAEVRNLAQRSATAAREIKTLIDDSVHQIEQGTELVTQSGETLQAIIVSVKQVSNLVTDIASASQEQAAGIEHVNQAVAQMDQITQSNAAQTEELSGTAETLSAQAQHMRALVSRFRLDLGEDSWEAHTEGFEHGQALAPAAPAPRSEAPMPASSSLGLTSNTSGAGSGVSDTPAAPGFDPDDPFSMGTARSDTQSFEEV